MAGIQHQAAFSDGVFHLHLQLSTAAGMDSPEIRIRRLISENPVIIFSRPSCCMCHVMKRLLSAVGVHPAVIELEECEIPAVGGAAPAVFIGGACVGGLESLVALHLRNDLVPKLVEVGALKLRNQYTL